MRAGRHRLLLLTELASWGLGLAGVVWWGAFQVGLARTARNDLERFAQLQHFALDADRTRPIPVVAQSRQRLAEGAPRTGS